MNTSLLRCHRLSTSITTVDLKAQPKQLRLLFSMSHVNSMHFVENVFSVELHFALSFSIFRLDYLFLYVASDYLFFCCSL